MTIWNVYVDGRCIGTVSETDEASARCAALHRFAVTEEEIVDAKRRGEDLGANVILPEQDFSVSSR